MAGYNLARREPEMLGSSQASALALLARRWDAVLLNEGNATMTDSIMFHEGNRELQDKFQSRRISDRLEEKLTRTTFTPADMTFIEHPLFLPRYRGCLRAAGLFVQRRLAGLCAGYRTVRARLPRL